MLEWSTNPQLFCLQDSSSILFTPNILQAKASLSDLQTRLDSAIFAEDLDLAILAKSIISSTQGWGVSQVLRLLVPT